MRHDPSRRAGVREMLAALAVACWEAGGAVLIVAVILGIAVACGGGR